MALIEARNVIHAHYRHKYHTATGFIATDTVIYGTSIFAPAKRTNHYCFL